MVSKRVKKYSLVTFVYLGVIAAAVLLLFQTGSISTKPAPSNSPTSSASPKAVPDLTIKFDKNTVVTVPPSDQVCENGVCTYLKNGPQFSTDKRKVFLSADPYKYFIAEAIPLTGGAVPEDNPVSLGVLDLEKFSSGNYRMLITAPNGPAWLFNLEVIRE